MNLSDYRIDRSKLRHLFSMLHEDSQPIWGKMNAQQMVEHLIDEIKWTNGKTICTCEKSREVSEMVKHLMIYSDILLPRNYRTGNLPVFYDFPSLESAIDQIFVELEDFEEYFSVPGQMATHPLFGPMNHYEWLVWQNKHFSHHFKQFGLLSSADRWSLSMKCPYSQNFVTESI